MGDVVALEPLVRQLAESGAEVMIAAKSGWQPLYGGHARIQWLASELPWTRYEAGRKYRLGGYLAKDFRDWLTQLRRAGRGAIGIDPRGDSRSILLLYLAGCRHVYTLENYIGFDLRIPGWVARLVPAPADQQKFTVNVGFLASLNLLPKMTPPDFRHLRSAPPGASSPFRKLGILPVAPWAGKLWDPARWRELIRQLRSAGFQVTGLCGPQQRELADQQSGLGDAIQSCADMAAWVEQLGSLDLLVTLDSGPMHLAAALGIPVVALFGQGKLPLWAPGGESVSVVHHQDSPDFRPCHPVEANAPLGREMMDQITVAEVLAAIHWVLKSV